MKLVNGKRSQLLEYLNDHSRNRINGTGESIPYLTHQVW